MTGSTGASIDEGRWLTSAYMMPYFVVLLVTPYIVGRVGRRRVWAVGHLLFATACLGCAASSDSYGALLFWRFVQGCAQGTFFVCAVSTVITIFPPNIAFLGLSFFAGTSLAGAAAGSAVGGYFADINQWTAMFVVFAVVALLSSLAVWLDGLDTAPIRPQVPFDGFGVALACVASYAFMFVTQFGERDDWFTSPVIDTYLAILIVTMAILVAWEGRLARAPFLDLRMFRFNNLRWGGILGFVLGIPLFGATTLVQYLQQSLHFSASLAGGELSLRIVTIVIIVPFVATALLKNLIDLRIIIVLGFLFVTLSYTLQYFATTSTAYFGSFVASILFSGFGFAMLFSPIASSILFTLPQALFTRGIALFKFLLTAGGLFATVVLQVIVDHRTSLHATELGGALQPGAPAFLINPAFTSASAALAPLLSQQSITLAYADSFLYTAIVVVLAVPLTFAIKPPGK